MDFQKVTFEGDLDEMDEEELVGLVRQFSDAQDDNIAEFETASEEIDDLEGRVSEVAEFDAELTEQLVEASPLDEDEVASFSISRKRSLLADFSEAEEEADEGGEGDKDFSEMGQRGPTHNEEEAKAQFAKDFLGDIPGLN
jgi:hypothetical protein